MARIDEPDRPVQETASATEPATRQGTRDTAQVAQEKGQEVASTARKGAAEVLDETTTQSRHLYAKAKEQVAGEGGTQVRRMASGVRRIADDLRHMSDEAKPDSPAASLVRQAADRGHQLADRFDRQDPGDLMDDVKNFARRRPGLFLAGAALAGFALSRMGRGLSATGDTPQRTSGVPREQYRQEPAATGYGQEATPVTTPEPEGTVPAPEQSGHALQEPGLPPHPPRPAPPVQSPSQQTSRPTSQQTSQQTSPQPPQSPPRRGGRSGREW